MLPDFYRPRSAPFAHQREAVETGWRREGFAYFLEMGLGKSRVTIDDFCLNVLEDRVDALLIVAPKSVYTNWTREDDENPGELQRWLWEELRAEAVVHTYRAGRRKSDIADRVALMDRSRPGVRILSINIEALASAHDARDLAERFLRTHRCMMVIDESTGIKTPSAARTKICIALARHTRLRRILTGSPSTGSLSDFWSQFEFLGPGRALLGHRLFTTFRARYCILREIVVSGRTIKTEVGSQNVEELADIVARHSIRRRKDECLDLPPKVYMKREVELTPEQDTAYRELRRSAMTVVEGSEVTTQIVITQLMRMHQVICGHVRTDDGRIVQIKNRRLEALLSLIEESGEQVVIWAGYRPDAELIVAELRRHYGEDSVAQWHGGRTQAEREADEAEFVTGRRRFMVATKAGARGRTWTCARLVVYYSNSHDLEVREQSEDRTHRIGTTGTVVYVDIVAPGTLDERIIDSLRSKRDVAHAVLRDGLGAWI